MKRVWQRWAAALGVLLLAAVTARPQAYTVSAKPGAVNYIEGHAYLDGKPLSDKGLRSSFLNTGDTLSTDLGKAEILLTPGVFLRIGNNSEVRMISPSLTDTQVELKKGEAMIEADGLMKENRIQVSVRGASIMIEKNGLYRFTADENPTAAVLDGKAQVYFGDKKIDLGKGRETLLSENLKPEKFDPKKEDDLYAWSNTRSEYDAASSYHAAKSVSVNSYSGGSGFDPAFGYGMGSWYGPGWYWNGAFNSWGWIPGNGAFYSPFGWGFYGLGYLPYAPVVVVPVRGANQTVKAVVPVNANKPPAIRAVTSSPAANQAARNQVAHSAASAGGFRTANGAPAPSFSGGRPTAAPSAHSAGPPSVGHVSSGVGHVSAPAPAGPHK
jgi:FecR protein